MKRRVVITGLGAVTALGEGAAALWEGISKGRTGIGAVRLDPHDENFILPGAAVKGFEPEKYVTQRKALKVMARDIQLAVAAASLALDDGSAKSIEILRERFGLIVGSGVLNHEIDELAASVMASLGAGQRLDLKKFGSEGLSALFPLWLLKYLPNMPACHISIFFNLQGPNNTLTTGPSAGLQAVSEAFHIIRRGSADCMLAGGAESKLNPLGLSQYRIQGVLADGDPLSASRPFDARSRGIVVGEAGAFLLLESLEHAVQRGAKIYAEITGVGLSSASGREAAMRMALAQARLEASDIDYLQASGLGLVREDKEEARAIESVLGESRDLLVGVSKPATGFTGFSSGAIDLIIACLAMDHQEVPPAMASAGAHSRYGFKIAGEFPVRKKIRHTLTNAFGLGGQCVTVALGVPPSAGVS